MAPGTPSRSSPGSGGKCEKAQFFSSGSDLECLESGALQGGTVVLLMVFYILTYMTIIINLSICSFIPIPMNIFHQASDSAAIHPSIHPPVHHSQFIHHHPSTTTHSWVNSCFSEALRTQAVSLFCSVSTQNVRLLPSSVLSSHGYGISSWTQHLSAFHPHSSVFEGQRELCSFNEENFPGGSSIDFPLCLLGQNCITWIFLNSPLSEENISS